VIRNVVMGRLRDPNSAADSAVLDRALAAIEALNVPGLISLVLGRDAGLRDGGWSFAITSDWIDAAAYRAYDLDAEHNRIRVELFAPVCDQIARVQLET
jgi:hypothetical protein